MENNVIQFPYKKFEEAEDINGNIVASTLAEHSDLSGAETVIDIVDNLNGVMGDEPLLEHLKNLIKNAKSKNHHQHMQSSECMKIYDGVYNGSPNSAA